MATTTMRNDYLGRELVTPASASKDHLGRATTATADYLGRPLHCELRVSATLYHVGDEIEFPTGERFIVTVQGTSATPDPPAVTATTNGATQADGTATIKRQL